MSTNNSFSYKFTTETEPFTFDFSLVLASAETITTATCTAIVVNGTDANPSNILHGAAYFVGTKATQVVTAGVQDVTYRLIMTITTNLANVYTAIGDLPVYAPSEM